MCSNFLRELGHTINKTSLLQMACLLDVASGSADRLSPTGDQAVYFILKNRHIGLWFTPAFDPQVFSMPH